jgi:hypothetical protein
MITSSSHLIFQKTSYKTWSQIKVQNKKNDIFKKAMVLGNMIKKKFGCSFANYYFGTMNEMSHICQTIYHHKYGLI